MIEVEFGPADVAGLRFAHSPMAEIVAGAFVLRDRGPGAWMHDSWRRRVTPLLPRWPVLSAVLFGPHHYAPDFLNPVPRGSRPTLDDELRLLAATPLDTIVEQVTAGWAGHEPPPEIQGFVRFPRTQTAVLIEELRDYFETAIAPLWPLLRAHVASEVAARSRAAAERGPRTMLTSLHPRLVWDGAAIRIGYPDKHGKWSLEGHDLTLLPTAFAAGNIFSIASAADGRALLYAPAGHGNLWASDPRPGPSPALAALLGPTRAAVLTLLAAPHSTGEVAHHLAIAPATASHHLTTLRDSGLVAPVRDGRRLLYQRTGMGDSLTLS
ncbi:winged helix-turn-helix domain-containing protein [Actinoplanes sp. NBRC 101535]|uniref:ArsR/SmtB family transcription factor n=1 Tax=Actinoplanes sp. NBRC 101535 TaxID=3032196 RepID=UPI0024A2FEFA|nr:winged helix-turn-helix domain-containing protein [Actinoplanes sp. NBRC 101535]GLY00567.1 transcriptional regulator [Actinoplanes sp. NBRC 101535]